MEWRKNRQPGQEIRILFLDGDQRLQRRVQDCANAWLEHANLIFAFGNQPNAEIRITFRGRGYQSYVGTDALRTDRSAPSMQLGGLRADSSETVIRRTVLHEFGHAIGCIHEQASPSVAIPWDTEKSTLFTGTGRTGTTRRSIRTCCFAIRPGIRFSAASIRIRSCNIRYLASSPKEILQLAGTTISRRAIRNLLPAFTLPSRGPSGKGLSYHERYSGQDDRIWTEPVS